MQVLYVANDNDVELKSLTDRRTSDLISDATVTFALKTAAGATVTTGSLTAVSGQQGVYRGQISSAISITAGDSYVLEVTAASDGRDGFWKVPCMGKDRKI